MEILQKLINKWLLKNVVLPFERNYGNKQARMHIHHSLLLDNQNDYQRFLFLSQKVREHAGGFDFCHNNYRQSCGYDMNHCENAEALGGHQFTFTLFIQQEKKKKEKNHTTYFCNSSDCHIRSDALILFCMEMIQMRKNISIATNVLEACELSVFAQAYQHESILPGKYLCQHFQRWYSSKM